MSDSASDNQASHENPKSSPPKLRIELETASCAHFVHAHLGLPIVRDLTVFKDGGRANGPIEARITFTPPFAAALTLRLDRLEPQSSHAWKAPALELNRELIASASEGQDATIRVELWDSCSPATNAAPGALLAQKNGALRLLAFNEWPGLGELPELLAAFVTPNQASISELLHGAGEWLRQTHGDSSIDGYQSNDPRRVLRLVEAIFVSVHSRQIHYVSPPASYEVTGQKVRFVEQVWLGRQGACLDLTLLFASALEAAGLHPVICVEKGHAFVGCWLREDRLFDLSFEDDVQVLRKGVDGLSLCVFETTLATQGAGTFSAAVAAARQRLENESDFRWALDIARARSKRVRPLPLAAQNGQIFIAPEPEPIRSAATASIGELEEMFTVLDRDLPQNVAAAEPPDARVARWKRQLLDLSLRNRLLNLSEKTTVRLLPGSLSELEDHFAEAGEVKLLERLAGDARDAGLHRLKTQEDLNLAQLKADLADHKLRTDETKDELESKLVKLERESRVAMDESGNNPLYLALGVLAWKEHPGAAAKTRYAPLLLLPVFLERKSMRSGFRLRRRDEDTLVNVTLIEKLKQDFEIEVKGVEPPPQDGLGVDVDLVLRRFSEAVADAAGFEVRRDAYLGLFSFSKFLLWRDLETRTADLKRSAVVAHLIDGRGRPFSHPGEPISPQETDQLVSPKDALNVLEADSSQLSAMINAGRELHFVLNGPPGSGKSQTIANMIAHCIAKGKSVLFVAEKKTALEVVQRRLEKVGLAPFCLELHSNKTGKTDFIRQMRDAVKFASQTTPEEWEALAKRLESQRASLNAYVQSLHRRASNGLSAYACFGLLIPNGGQMKPPVSLQIKDPTAQSIEERNALKELVAELALRLSHFPNPTSHPLKRMGPASYSRAWEQELAQNLQDLKSRVLAADSSAADILRLLKLPAKGETREQLSALGLLARQATTVPPAAAAFFRRLDYPALTQTARDALTRAQARDQALAALADYDAEKVLGFDFISFERIWDESEKSFALLRWWKRRALLRQIQELRRQQDPVEADAVKPFIEKARRFADAHRKLAEVHEPMQSLLGELWAEGDPVPEKIEAALIWQETTGRALHALAGDDYASLGLLVDAWGSLATSARDFLRVGQPPADKLLSAAADLEAVDEKARSVLALAAMGAPAAGVLYLQDLRFLCDDLLQSRAEWQRWTLLQSSLSAGRERGLGPFCTALCEGEIPRSMAMDTFDRAYAWATLQVILDREPALLNFFGDEHEQAIERFRELDTKLTDINSRYVVAKAAANRPSGLNDSKVFGEIALLRSEIEKKTNWKAVRALLASIPTLLPRLKPCVLMSPLSVAQYLDAAHPPFDVVIFDEASQIPVCDAVGALARGKQTVVAGDPKQLPPTSFFQKVDLGEEEDEEDATGQPVPRDQESILDECLSAQIPEHHLAWHYRSRREALIAFSNLHYYENRLLTFPAPEAKEEGVFFHHVSSGHYDRGASRTNKEEALAVVRAVKAHVLNAGKEGQSLAVITFNTEQMTLIENLLDAERLKDPAFDEAMNARTASHLEEPFKVRNLESIQGDERDVVFFSITYGPDSSGYVSHNFGPLNKPGGERRLNVAITRAKHAVHIFSSLRSHHIDLKRTGARGVRDLKSYLQYAEEGVAALARSAAKAAEEHDYDSVFERHVASSLRDKGWEVLTQIGCSAYRIDLAVIHPDKPGRFLAGVECDGATYHRAATARDRDRLRQRFLEGLGWRIMRTWSTDWFRDPSKEADRLHHALLGELKAKEVNEPAPVAPPPVRVFDREETILSHAVKTEPTAVAPAAPSHTRYEATVLPPVHFDKDRFADPMMRSVISGQIERVMQLEAPISVSLLTARIREAWGFGRAGAKIEQAILSALPRDVSKRGNFLWRGDQHLADFTLFRSDTPESETRRNLEDIAPEEQAAAMAWLIERFVRVPEEDLLKETAAIFGRKAFTDSARAALKPGFQTLLAKGYSLTAGNHVQKNT